MTRDMERRIWERARRRCEYCHMPQEFHEHSLQIDHIISKKHDGEDDELNLALACFRCNSRKGPNIAGIDPESKLVTALFHPRKDHWADHFVWSKEQLVGKTAAARVTIAVLQINAPHALRLRRALMAQNVSFE